MIYLDNAATSWPKPERVYTKADEAMRRSGNPGRSGHVFSLYSSKAIEETRMRAAALFGVHAPGWIVFSLNTTDALNTAIKGVVGPGDHVVTSSLEHNSVIRPLDALADMGVTYTIVRADPVGGVDPRDVKKALRPNTRLAVFTHVSNVTGTIVPVREIGAVCREAGIVFLIDVAQSAGVIPLDVGALDADMIAFPGHKGLLGPQGTGGLYIKEGTPITPSRQGGTGNVSESIVHPQNMPYAFESGTPNTPGIAALGEGIAYVMERGAATIGKAETALANRLIGGLEGVKGVKVFGPPAGPERSGTVSFRLRGMDPAETGAVLSSAFGIAVRPGLHCSRLAHETIGTLDTGGTVRVSVGAFNTEADVDACVAALEEIAAGARS
ncbi:MAG: aminotransferase class V-fold PLP-dependent enzyme [Clostridiales Family XIII bacterium]|nr:aminotransferase class V-fold PLP-dependent enzyme [Clostridiales Family XIII bacterium]